MPTPDNVPTQQILPMFVARHSPRNKCRDSRFIPRTTVVVFWYQAAGRRYRSAKAQADPRRATHNDSTIRIPFDPAPRDLGLRWLGVNGNDVEQLAR